MGKMCFVTFPTDFYRANKELVEEVVSHLDCAEVVVSDYDYAREYQFSGEMAEDANDYFTEFHNEHKDIPMVVWQETDEGGYDFSYGMTSYYLPNQKPIHVPHNHTYGVVNVSKLKTLTSMEELKALIEKKESENPIPNMDKVFKEYRIQFREKFQRENCGL